MDDKPVMRWPWTFWAALAAGGILWLGIWWIGTMAYLAWHYLYER